MPKPKKEAPKLTSEMEIGDPARAAAKAGAPKSGERARCSACDRQLLPGAPCPFCIAQHFGDGDLSTVMVAHKPESSLAALGGVLVASKAAREHAAKGFLHVYRGTNKGATVLLDVRTVTIGRDAATCSLPINDASVSAKHCEIRPDKGGGYRVVDMKSKNGTYVNDVRVTDRKLDGGDVLAFGETRVYVGVM